VNEYSGKSIGRYHILEQLGEGGMAVVYKAFDTNLNCDVAIKFIRSQKLSGDHHQMVLKRFKTEAQKTAALDHPNIVPVLDYGEFEGVPFLVMKYFPGGTLKKALQERAQRNQGPYPYQAAAAILVPIARALETAHRNGIVHRDVKPSNILLTQTGLPMLTDFGVAKVLESDETIDRTSLGTGIGTPEYMAPEQWEGIDIDGRADVYALGITFYEMITGRVPYTADTVPAILIKMLRDPLPRPREFVPDIPEEVERVVFKALAKVPQDRYANMETFSIALEGLINGDLGTGRPGTTSHTAAGQSNPPAEGKPPTGSRRTRTGLWIVGGIAVLLAASVLLFQLGIPGIGVLVSPTLTAEGRGESFSATLLSPGVTSPGVAAQPSATPETKESQLKTQCGVEPVTDILAEYNVVYYNDFSKGLQDIELWGADVQVSDGILINTGHDSWKTLGRPDHMKSGKGYLIRFRYTSTALFHIYIEQPGYGLASLRLWGININNGQIIPEARLGTEFTTINIDWQQNDIHLSSDQWICAFLSVDDTTFSTRVWNPGEPQQLAHVSEDMGEEWANFTGLSALATEIGVLEVDSFSELSRKE
jgi:tRNA A-37 threonylcarbamoyl transferase component Bud32